MEKRVTVFFVICEQIPLAKKALTILQFSYGIELIDLIVVLNGISEEEKRFLDLKDCKIVIKEKKESYARVLNQQLRELQTEFFALIHSDTIVTKNWLLASLALFDRDSTQEEISSEFHELIAVYPSTGKDHQNLNKKIENLKSSIKTPLTSELIDSLLERIYGTEGIEGYQKGLARKSEFWYTIIFEFQSYCVVIKTASFKRIAEKFSEEFEGFGGEMRLFCTQCLQAGYYFARLNMSYVHHWGNMTTDRIGMNYLEQLRRQNDLLEKIEIE
jgi:hypothetical protein